MTGTRIGADGGTAVTVGQVAESVGVTVRTLHHYDAIGLVSPSRRSAAGYRLYTADDVTRLRHVVVYRRLGFALEDIAVLLDDPSADVAAHLRRQRSAVMARLDEMTDLVAAIDRALEAEMDDVALTPDEQRELFGEHFSDEDAAEAEQRWGDTPEWEQSRARTARYTKDDWARIAAEGEEVTAEFVRLKRAGEPADGAAAADAAEAQRESIDRWFYDCGAEMHATVSGLYVSDERFRRRYDDREPGLAAYVHAAARANRDRG